MPQKLDRWTTALSALLLVSALLACKKKAPETTAPSAAPVAAAPAAPATPEPAAPAAPAAPSAVALGDVGAKLGEVKRYTDKEKAETGTARILENAVKVFDEADDKTAEVATLDKDLLVFRLASIPGWELVEFPSGVGKVSPGWVLAKFIDVKTAASVDRAAVATQAKQAVVAAPKASTGAVASAAKPAASVAVTPAAAAAASASAAAANAAAAASAAAANPAAAANRAAQVAARAAARKSAKP